MQQGGRTVRPQQPPRHRGRGPPCHGLAMSLRAHERALAPCVTSRLGVQGGVSPASHTRLVVQGGVSPASHTRLVVQGGVSPACHASQACACARFIVRGGAPSTYHSRLRLLSFNRAHSESRATSELAPSYHAGARRRRRSAADASATPSAASARRRLMQFSWPFSAPFAHHFTASRLSTGTPSPNS